MPVIHTGINLFFTRWIKNCLMDRLQNVDVCGVTINHCVCSKVTGVLV